MEKNYEEIFSKDQIKRLDELVVKYSVCDSKEIFERLWKMTYNPLSAIIDESLGIINFDTEYNIEIRDYIVSKLKRKDIINSRRTLANDGLFRAFNNDKFSVKRIEEVIKTTFSNCSLNELEKIGFQLNSIKNSSITNGLINLGLNEKEAVYFLKFSKDIFKYFNKKYENKQGKIMAKENKDKKITLIDLIVLLHENKELVLDIIKESEKFSKLYDDPDVQKYSINKIFKVSDALISAQKIIDDSENLKKLGINPNWILENSYVILKLLSTDFLKSWND